MTAPTSRGVLSISEKALTKIILAAVTSVPGTKRIDSSFGRGYPRIDLQLDGDGDTMSADIVIATTWPAPTITVAEQVRDTVDAHIRAMTDIRPVRINVSTGAVENADPVTSEQLAAHNPAPALRQVHVVRPPLREVTTTSTIEVYEPLIFHEFEELTPITVDKPVPLRKVNTAPQLPKVEVRTARPMQLAPIRTNKAPAIYVPKKQPAQQELRQVRVVPSPMRAVEPPIPVTPVPVRVLPQQSELAKPVRVSPAPLRRVSAPVPVTPVPVQVSSTPLRRVGVQRQPLKPVRVQPRQVDRIVVNPPAIVAPQVRKEARRG